MLNTLPILEHSWRVQEVMEWGREEVREEAAKAVEEANRALEEEREKAARALEEAARAREEAARVQLQTFQQSAISLVAARFPQLAQLAQIIISTVSDVARLQTLIVELGTVSDEEQATALLTALVKTSPSESPLPVPIKTE